jgi:putative flippase GtrA
MPEHNFIKVQAASIAGSVLDYLTTILFVEYFHCWYLLANFTGNIFGGAFLFILCRKWIFHTSEQNVRLQIAKFILVFAGNLLLSAVGVFLITHFFRINYIISKTMVSVLLGISYNYIMQKRFVFS